MIASIAQLAKIDSLLANLSVKRFNAVLPVTIEVLEEPKPPAPQTYKLLVGKQQIDTKSGIPLEKGVQYWGMMRENPKSGAITLSRLLQKPKLLQNRASVSFLPEFTPQKLVALLSKEKPGSEMKAVLLEHLSQATSRHEFLTLTNMLSALHAGVFTMLLRHEEKATLFQFKRRKTQSQTSSEDGMIDFYAAFEHIGPVEGVVEVSGDIRRVTLYLYYTQSLEFVRHHLDALPIEGKVLPKTAKIAPLYEPTASLLDIKG